MYSTEQVKLLQIIFKIEMDNAGEYICNGKPCIFPNF